MAGGFRQTRGRSGTLGLVALVALGLCVWDTSSAFSLHLNRHVKQTEPAPEVVEEKATTVASFVAGHTAIVVAVVMIASALVARQEPPPPPPATVTPIEKRSDFTLVAFVTILLSGISGMVNAVAIITMGGTVAHHTGNASHTGRLLGVDGARFAVLILAYFVGAGVAGFRKSSGEQALTGKASPALLGSALAVYGAAVIHWASGNSLMALPVLAFSQGIHNAVTSKCTSMPLRTTHMTGTLTDTGAAFGAWVRSKTHGDAPPPVEKFVFLFLTMVAFSIGGVLAKMCCDSIGSLALLPPAAALAILALGVLPWPAPAEKA